MVVFISVVLCFLFIFANLLSLVHDTEWLFCFTYVTSTLISLLLSMSCCLPNWAIVTVDCSVVTCCAGRHKERTMET